MSPQNSMQGRQGDPQMGMLDLSSIALAEAKPAPVAAAPLRSVSDQRGSDSRRADNAGADPSAQSGSCWRLSRILE